MIKTIEIEGYVAGIYVNNQPRGPAATISLFENIRGSEVDEKGFEKSVAIRVALWKLQVPEGVEKKSYIRVQGTCSGFSDYKGTTQLNINVNPDGGLIELTPAPVKGESKKTSTTEHRKVSVPASVEESDDDGSVPF